MVLPIARRSQVFLSHPATPLFLDAGAFWWGAFLRLSLKPEETTRRRSSLCLLHSGPSAASVPGFSPPCREGSRLRQSKRLLSRFRISPPKRPNVLRFCASHRFPYLPGGPFFLPPRSTRLRVSLNTAWNFSSFPPTLFFVAF